MKKKYMSPVISIMEMETPTLLLDGSSTSVKGQTRDSDPIEFGGDTKANTTYSPW